MRAVPRVTEDPTRGEPFVRTAGTSTAPTWAIIAGPVALGLFGAMFGGFTGSAAVALAFGGVGVVTGYFLVQDAYSA